jgi:hypothetical protein
MILFRPVGLDEMRLVFESGLREFPPRLPTQPFFYPVLTEDYAVQVARDWNTREAAYAGYVTSFTLADGLASRYPVQTVGAAVHQELWVPAQELSTFNAHISPPIRVTHAFFGAGFEGLVPDRFMLAGRRARQQFVLLETLAREYGMDFISELRANPAPVFLHYPFWGQADFADAGIDPTRRDAVLASLAKIWSELYPGLPLPDPVDGAA